MTQTVTKTKAPVARKRPVAKKTITQDRLASIRRPAVVERSAAASEHVLRSVETAERAAIEAVRTFVETVDEALPVLGENPARRQDLIDAALEMADKLVTTQYEFLHGVVRNVSWSLGTPSPKARAEMPMARKTAPKARKTTPKARKTTPTARKTAPKARKTTAKAAR
jgi:hypothetical protein